MTKSIKLGPHIALPDQNCVERDGVRVSVEPKAMEVLIYLCERAGEVCSKEEIFDAVWGTSYLSDEVLTNAISKLRLAFGDDARNPSVIRTIPRRGYCLIAATDQTLPSAGPDPRYEIEDKIASGEIGDMYLARDRRLRRRVVLKILSAKLSNNHSARQFLLREARATAALDHPNICRIYDTGEFDGRAFIAMEHLDGEPLSRLLERSLPSTEEALSITRQVAAAAAAAHERGLVHRDIKPANIIVTKTGTVKVMNFGLARRIPARKGSLADWSSTFEDLESWANEYAYRSPEQMRSEAVVDRRSDIFSLGVVLIELLAGEHPFRRSTSVHTAIAIISEPVRIPPLLESTPLNSLLRRMIAKDPMERFDSMWDVIECCTQIGSFDFR